MLIIRSNQMDVYRNLAAEEWLFNHAPHLPILFLYVNRPCVVIGKNQNPWRECQLALMEKEGVRLARRVSGGGAVYHDLGNLNVSVIVPRTDYREEKQYELIFRALESLSVPRSTLSKLGRTALAVHGRKFSGHAFCHRRERTLHHGTLLVNADLDRLGRYLGAELDGIETKAIASVPATVANLVAGAPSLSVETLSRALCETFRAMYSADELHEWYPSEQQIAPLVDKISSRAWTLGCTPTFRYRGVEVEKGRVNSLAGAPLFEEWLKNEC